MKNNSPYKSILGPVFGLSLLYIFKGFDWIPYVITVISFLALAFRRFVVFIDAILHYVFVFIGNLLSTFILTLFYYFLLFPISLLAKIFHKKDTLQLKKPISTNFKNTNKTYSKESFKNLW
ncbi:hypothetical protein [Polaribacter sp.]|uniref:hypothetical protein n=1 Tax=Polaribacter sp. TaxID=1920175 RepID=UPI003EF7E40E